MGNKSLTDNLSIASSVLSIVGVSILSARKEYNLSGKILVIACFSTLIGLILMVIFFTLLQKKYNNLTQNKGATLRGKVVYQLFLALILIIGGVLDYLIMTEVVYKSLSEWLS